RSERDPSRRAHPSWRGAAARAATYRDPAHPLRRASARRRGMTGNRAATTGPIRTVPAADHARGMSSSGSGPSSPAGSAARGPDLERFVSWVREQAIAHPLRATVIATATGYVVGGGLPRRFTRVFLATAVRAAA